MNGSSSQSMTKRWKAMKKGMNLPLLSLESAGTTKRQHPSSRSQLSTQSPPPETGCLSVKTVNKLSILCLTPLTNCLGSGCDMQCKFYY